MNNLTVVYLGNYQVEEEAAFAAEGFPTARVGGGAGAAPSKLLPTIPGGRLLVRSERLEKADYETFWNSVRSVGARPVTPPKSFELMNSFRLYYPAIASISPKAVIADANLSYERILDLVKSSNLKPPLFVRTELESAAKYVGVEACIMHNVDLASTRRTISLTRENIKRFKEIVIKEVCPIASVGGKRLEYRAIGAGGRLVTFDLAETSPLPTPSAEVVQTTEKALSLLSNYGATGAVFVDVALGEDGSAMVVECKDFTNGTIANVKAVAAGWSRWSSAARA